MFVYLQLNFVGAVQDIVSNCYLSTHQNFFFVLSHHLQIKGHRLDLCLFVEEYVYFLADNRIELDLVHMVNPH
jgi:hypothetical protein